MITFRANLQGVNASQCNVLTVIINTDVSVCVCIYNKAALCKNYTSCAKQWFFCPTA